MNKCIASSVETATISDIWLFMTYLYCHPKLMSLGQNIWLCLGQFFLPELIFHTGKWLSQLALDISNQALQMLPALKRKTGFIRRIADPVNKLLLLFKIRKEKQHRNRVAATHQELGGNTSRMMVFEAYLDCLLHMKALAKWSPELKQISIHWDPSTYGGKDVLMGIAYDSASHKAAYVMCQQMSQTLMSELDPSLLPLAKTRKLCRLEGFKELKGLSSALESIGMSIADFQVPEGLVCRPLKPNELRLTGPDGAHYIHCEDTGTVVPEVPPGLDLGSIPCLISVSDQGPNVVAGTNFLMYSKDACLFLAQYDPYHRCWNDLKTALKRSICKAWNVVLELTLVANLNYGPFGSSTWHFKKKAKLEDFVTTKDIHHPLWQKYQHLISRERRLPEPATLNESFALFDTIKTLESFERKGPLIKLMRWFSWFESMAFYNGELWCTKMVLEDSMLTEEQGSEKEIDEKPLGTEKDHHKELQDLKKRKGSWKLAPTLINEKNLAVKDVIMAICKSCWKLFAGRARELVSPNHILEHNIGCVHQDFWKHELVEMVVSSLFEEKPLQHLLPEFSSHEKTLEWHVDLFDKLMETRAQSLAVFHCLPPNLYNHLLSPIPDIALKAHQLAVKHWKVLLAAEGAQNEGHVVKPLTTMYWRFNPLVRCLLMSYELDEAQGKFRTSHSSAFKLQRAIAKHLGDSSHRKYPPTW